MQLQFTRPRGVQLCLPLIFDICPQIVAQLSLFNVNTWMEVPAGLFMSVCECVCGACVENKRHECKKKKEEVRKAESSYEVKAKAEKRRR